MYFGRGFALSEVGDCHVIAHEGRLHLFHVVLPGHDIVAHLVSEDGVSWTPVAHALRVGDPGDFDDDQIWTMSVFPWKGRFHMLYTALAQAEDGLIQRTGLAVSEDLMTWEKMPNNPVAAPDARWYEADTSESGRADWRDPFGWVEGDTIHALVCAHAKDGPQNRRGCIGYFTSQDALHWEVKPPFYAAGLHSDWEVPAVMKLGERYFLLGHSCAPPQGIYRYADQLEGPWVRPEDDRILPPGAFIFTPVQWQGKTLIYHWIVAQFDWPDRRRVTGPGNGTRAIAPPKEAVVLENGELILRSVESIWTGLTVGTLQPSLEPAKERCCGGDWSVAHQVLTGTSGTGMGVAHLPGEYADFVCEATVVIKNAREAGLCWRSDETANLGTFVALIPARKRIELQRVLAGPPGEPGRLGRGFSTLQENSCAVETGQAARVRVVAWGPYVEISVDGRVVLCYLTMSRRAGRLGFFANDGAAEFTDVTVRILKPPPMPECAG